MSETYYTKDHEWITVVQEKSSENSVATIGITDYAQESLGEIVFIDLPSLGQFFNAGDTVAVVESVKAASDIFLPIDGEIIEINEQLDESPELVNESPENEGWFIKIRSNKLIDQEPFMTHERYKKFTDS